MWPTLGWRDLLSIRHGAPLLPDLSPGFTVPPPPPPADVIGLVHLGGDEACCLCGL